VGILDADKEGYLRSRTSLIQTIGRAARNVEGRVLLYADRITDSMKYALDETSRRRTKQMAWNEAHGITPQTIKKDISDILNSVYERADHVNVKVSGGQNFQGKDLKTIIAEMEVKMRDAAVNLEFEEAARLRDEIKRLEASELGLDAPGMPASAMRNTSRPASRNAEIDAPIQPPSGRKPKR